MRWLGLAGAAGCLFALTGWISGLAAQQASGLAALWGANAVLLAIMLTACRTRRDCMAVAGAGLIAGLLLHLWWADAAATTIIFSIANVAECVAALLVLRLLTVSGQRFERVSDVLAFVCACAAGAALSATLAAMALTVDHSAVYAEAWASWYVTALLSQLVLTPLIVTCVGLARTGWLRTIGHWRAVEAVLILGLVAAATIIVFFHSQMPMTFVIEPALLMATIRLRTPGAVAGVAIVAIIAVVAMVTGIGRVAHAIPDAASRAMWLQLFLAVSFLATLPVAAMLAERDRQAEEAWLLAERFRAVVENIDEVIFRSDVEGRWTYLNPAWEALVGGTVDACLGRSWLDPVDARDRQEIAGRVAPILTGAVATGRLEFRLDVAGQVRWVEMFVQGLSDRDGRIIGTTGTLRDIDDRRRLADDVLSAKEAAEDRARRATLLASTDELTGLANRRAFLRRLDRATGIATATGGRLAVAMFDVDHFKAVNDRHGHAVGDRVLREIAIRADAVVRSGDAVGRLGGEEFAVLMPGATPEIAHAIAERLREAMETPRPDNDVTLPRVTISVGVAMHDGHGDAPDLLAAADRALYAAKEEGRNRVRIAA